MLRSRVSGSGRPARTTTRWPAGVDVVPDRSGTRPGPVRCSCRRPSTRAAGAGAGGRGPSLSVIVVVLVVLAAVAYGGYALIAQPAHSDERRAAVEKFTRRGRRATTRRCTRCWTRRAARRTRRSRSSPTTGARTAPRACEKITLGTVGPLLSGGNVQRAGDGHDQGLRHAQGHADVQATRSEDVAPRRLVAGAAAARAAQGRGGAPPQRRRARSAGTSTPPAASC